MDNTSSIEPTSTNNHIIVTEKNIMDDKDQLSNPSNSNHITSIIHASQPSHITGTLKGNKFDLTPVPPPRRPKTRKNKRKGIKINILI
jgi:hypothetical protein